MMKKYISFILPIIFMHSCIKVDDWQEGFLLETLFKNNDSRLLDYYAINNSNKQIMWKEEFDNNNSKWPVDTSNYCQISQLSNNFSIFPMEKVFKTIQMHNGVLMIHCYNLAIETADIPFTIDENKNFEIEMRTFISDNIVGRSQPREINVLSSSDNTKYNLLLYKWNDNVDIVLEKEKNGRCQQYLDWNSQDYLKLNELNIITIRRIAGKYTFFFNHKLFCILNDDKFFCNKSHIVFHEGVDYMFDYVRVQYIVD